MTIYRGLGGVNREVKQEFRGLGGVNREVKEQYRGYGGVNRQVFKKQHTLGDLSIGDGLNIAMDSLGTKLFSVVAKNHPGTPTNSVMLLSRYSVATAVFHNSSNNNYGSSTNFAWMNGLFLSFFPTKVATALQGVSVKVGIGGTANISTVFGKIHLPSLTEAGFTGSYVEGYVMPGIPAILDSGSEWFTRTPASTDTKKVSYINGNTTSITFASQAEQIRPMLCVSESLVISDTANTSGVYTIL